MTTPAEFQQRIRDRQAVFDAFDRGEISGDEYTRRLADLPILPAPRPDGGGSPIKRRGLDLVSRGLDIVERAFIGRKVE